MTGTSEADVDLSGGLEWGEVLNWLTDTALSGVVGAALSAGVAMLVLRRSWAHQEQRRKEDREQEEQRRAEDREHQEQRRVEDRRLEDERRQAQWDREQDRRDEDRLLERILELRGKLSGLTRGGYDLSVPQVLDLWEATWPDLLVVVHWTEERYPQFSRLLFGCWRQGVIGGLLLGRGNSPEGENADRERTASALWLVKFEIDRWMTDPGHGEQRSDDETDYMVMQISNAHDQP